jgi:hypothetical protein
VTVEAWLRAAAADAGRRGLHELTPLLESLARSMTALRSFEFSGEPTGRQPPATGAAASPSGRHDD